MVSVEPVNIRTTGRDTNKSTMLTLLLELNVICGQRWIQFELQNSLSRAFAIDGKIYTAFNESLKSNHNKNFVYVKNNRIKITKIFPLRSIPVRQFPLKIIGMK